MENLKFIVDDKEATVGVNGQNGQEEREARLRHLILNECKNVDASPLYDRLHRKYEALQAYAIHKRKIRNSFVEQIQNIDPSYTEEEINNMIDKIYKNEYYEMCEDDFLTCLSYQNVTLDDYNDYLLNKNATVDYRNYIISYIFNDLAYTYTYYKIASSEGLFKNPAMFDLIYNAYKSAAIAYVEIVENLMKDLKDKLLSIMIYGLDYSEDLSKKLVDKMLEKVNISYEVELSDFEYDFEPAESWYVDPTDKYLGAIFTTITIRYLFDPNIAKEIDQTLRSDKDITLEEMIKYHFDKKKYFDNKYWNYDCNLQKNEYSIIQKRDIQPWFEVKPEAIKALKNRLEKLKHGNNEEKTEDNTLLQP